MTPDNVQEAVDILNRALAADPEAITKLMFMKVPCNEALGNDPTIQVNYEPMQASDEISVLGLINGLFGVDANHCGRIGMLVDGGQPAKAFQCVGRGTK